MIKALEKMSEWPLDGSISFAAICLCLVLFIASGFISEKDHIKPENGTIKLKNSKSAILVTLGIVIGAVTILYGTQFAQNTPSNPHNTLWAAALFAFAFLLIPYFLYWYTLGYAFSKDFLIITSPVRKERKYFWDKLIEASDFMGSSYLRFEGSNRVFTPPPLLSKKGSSQFTSFVNLQILSLEKRFGEFDEEFFSRDKIGKKILINIIYVEEDYTIKRSPGEILGTIKNINADAIEVQCNHDNFSIVSCAPNTKSVYIADEYTRSDIQETLELKQKEVPELIGTWFTQNPKYKDLKPLI